MFQTNSTQISHIFQLNEKSLESDSETKTSEKNKNIIKFKIYLKIDLIFRKQLDVNSLPYDIILLIVCRHKRESFLLWKGIE